MESIELNGRALHMFTSGSNGPTIFWGIGPGAAAEAAETDALLRQSTDRPYRLMAYEAVDWNRDFSPWPAPAVQKTPFSGGAVDMLDWLRSSAIPFTDTTPEKCWIGGYSLSGLFSLWALGSGLFSGAIGVSPSLWFPGWAEYAQSICLPDGCGVYLSLGKQEARPRNPAMASVGDRVCAFYEQLQATAACRFCTMEWNPGGHFTDPATRMARGFAAMLNGKMRMD